MEHEQTSVPVGPNCVGKWAVVRSRDAFFEAVRIDVVTPKLIKTRRYSHRYSQYPHDCIVVIFAEKEIAQQTVQALDGVRGSFTPARRAEYQRHSEALVSIVERQAKAIDEAIAAIQAAKDESPVTK